jgi:hypothetical protein
VPGARVRIEFMEQVGRHLTREELRKLYEDFDVLKSDKNRQVLRDELAANRKPKPPGPKEYDAHHYLPLQFEKEFLLAGLDPNDAQFGEWVEVKKHSAWHGKDPETGQFNKRWRVFLAGKPNGATRAEILTELGKIKKEFKP